MRRGYLALWRKLQDHPFWKEKREFSKAEAWIDLLWEAQHSEDPQEVVLGMTVLICNYGESLKSLETWSKRWGWNKSRVRRFFKLLENMNQIRPKSETKTTRITVLNYSQYDPKRNASETQAKRKRNASETQATPDKNVKNERMKEKKTIGDSKNHLCPHLKIVSIYNKILNTHSQVKESLWGGTRKKALAARWNEDKERQSLSWWDNFFKTVADTPFLSGENNRGWRADMAWLVNPANMAKVLEVKWPRSDESVKLGLTAEQIKNRADIDDIMSQIKDKK